MGLVGRVWLAGFGWLALAGVLPSAHHVRSSFQKGSNNLLVPPAGRLMESSGRLAVSLADADLAHVDQADHQLIAAHGSGFT